MPNSSNGTIAFPKYYDGPADSQGDVHLRIRYFTYETDAGLVVGRNTSEVFTIDRPARNVWPYIKDFNLWQNSYGYYYTGVVGDLHSSPTSHIGEKTFRIGSKPDDPSSLYPYEYQVLRIVPEHLIVISQPVPEDGSTGGVSPGFHLIMLNEHGSKTVVTFYTEHAHRTTDQTAEAALAPYREDAAETLRKFRDSFIPTLKKLVYEAQ